MHPWKGLSLCHLRLAIFRVSHLKGRLISSLVSAVVTVRDIFIFRVYRFAECWSVIHVSFQDLVISMFLFSMKAIEIYLGRVVADRGCFKRLIFLIASTLFKCIFLFSFFMVSFGILTCISLCIYHRISSVLELILNISFLFWFPIYLSSAFLIIAINLLFIFLMFFFVIA